MGRQIEIFPDLAGLSRRAAELFVSAAASSIAAGGRFTVCLSGGSTPKSLFNTLTSADFADKADWSKIVFFFGDERMVPVTSSDSNFRSADENLFAPLRIAGNQIFRWPVEAETPQQAATTYEKTLTAFFGLSGQAASGAPAPDRPRFDLCLLGMGPDGHTASLFPNTSALGEKTKIAVANRVDKLKTTRLTLTFPVINNSSEILFLVSGADKAAALKDVLEGPVLPLERPAQNIKPVNGRLYWLVDAAAGRLVPSAEVLRDKIS
jgi:6-phosphogluconolactonase